ncbi:MAG TPA: hypothetical protein VEA38_25725, partial [Terriglobales bacterium]|nr:hypothetical protein [Terriglobales bacterium]
MHSLTERVVTKRVKVDGTNYAGAANTTDLTSESVDTLGFDGVRFLVGFGAITAGAVTSVKAQQSTADGSGQSDLAGSSQSVADTDDNKVVIIDIYRPQERYVNTVIDRGTQNAVVDFVIAELYSGRKQPVTQDATIVGAAAEVFASPEEG